MLERIVGPAWLASLLLVLMVAPVYALTAVYAQSDVNVDAEAAAITAWSAAERGTQDLGGVDRSTHPRAAEVLDRNPWIGTAPDATFSNRPPGLWLSAVPAYWAFGGDDYSPVPGTATATTLTVVAVVVANLALRRLVPPSAAWLGTLGLAFLTPTWPISSAQLWPHGPGQLLVALALLAQAHRRAGWASLALALAGTVRPITLVMPTVLGLTEALRRRWERVLALALGVLAGAGLVAAYNKATFGVLNLSGGYPSGFQERLVDQSALDYLGNVVLFLVSPENGLLVWTPVLIPAAIGARHIWSNQPSWARHGVVAAAAYLLVHARLNRVSGGLAYDYRYPLEPLVLMLPMGVQGVRWCLAQAGAMRLLVLATVGISFGLQAIVATTADCEPREGSSNLSCTLL